MSRPPAWLSPCHTQTECLVLFGKRSEHPAPSMVSFDLSRAWPGRGLAQRGQSWSLGLLGIKMGRQVQGGLHSAAEAD